MPEQSIVIVGLPESGKTTFLAALWHLITSREIKTELQLDRLTVGDMSHLNSIATRWRDAKVQDRTVLTGQRLVSMNLRGVEGLSLRLTFPDLPGEVYRRMWEDRECEADIAEVLCAQGVLLLIHADSIKAPRWVIDDVVLGDAMGLPPSDEEPVEWNPSQSPTQVQLVDLLQLLCVYPLAAGPRRLAVMLSAWDKASEERLAPRAFLAAKLPLLDQYLVSGSDGWDWRVYGLSAQGGDYDSVDEDAEKRASAEDLRNLDRPSSRIRLVDAERQTHDLTEPLLWLIS